MTDKKFTDEEIIETLECCAYSDGCERCQCSKQCDGAEHLINALDLINRQKAEIERLNSANDEKFRQWDMLAEKTKQHYADLYNEAKNILKTEAYKEFAERLCEGKVSNDKTVIEAKVLLKEMVGEEE
jgi:hypothetical protein